ncbi:MAG: DUF6268 family outer membrane beta-barrel protein [Planctomycetia bacterium]|nr:DUF6268 family outer membrane beta-barrel protein [Planctomycetia bacterium]
MMLRRIVLPLLLFVPLAFSGTGWGETYRDGDELPFPFNEPTEKTAPLPSAKERIEDDNVRQSFFQKIDFKQTVLDSFGGGDRLGISTTEITATFALPAFQGRGYFLFQPWFTQNVWYATPETYRYADSLFQAGISLGWMKEWNERWSLFAFFAPNYSGDYKSYAGQGFRFPGGVVLDWKQSDTLKWSVGVVYTAWEQWSVLPYGGVTWTPNEDWKWELVLPRPRICRRLNSPFSEKRYWGYLAGEYGGGIWNVETPYGSRDDLLSYRDLRCMVGIEGDKRRIGALDWSAEIGVAFCRKVYWDRSDAVFRPEPGLVMRLRITY